MNDDIEYIELDISKPQYIDVDIIRNLNNVVTYADIKDQNVVYFELVGNTLRPVKKPHNINLYHVGDIDETFRNVQKKYESLSKKEKKKLHKKIDKLDKQLKKAYKKQNQ